MKFNNETKVGIFFVVAVALLLWGYKFLKGINLLTTSQIFYVRYDHVEQLRPSSPVFLNGLQIGVVKSLVQDPEDGRKILASLNVERGFAIPKSAEAVIISSSLMGGKAIDLKFDHPCTDGNCARSGDYLQGRVRSFLESTLGDPSELDAYTHRLQVGLTAVYDSIADPGDPKGFGRTLVGLQNTLTNLAITTAKINRLLDATTANLSTTTANIASITGVISQGNQNIKNALVNLDAVTTQLRGMNFQPTFDRANAAMDSAMLSLSSLRQTLHQTTQSLQQVSALTSKLNAGEGSAGKLLTDPQLYENLVRDTRELHLLMQDLRLNPKRYTTIRLKLFGKHKPPPFVYPQRDPANQ